MLNHTESSCSRSNTVCHPIGQLFRFSLVTASLLFAESLAIHPSTGIYSRSRRSASIPGIANHKSFNAHNFIASSVLRSSAQSETEEQLVINSDESAEIIDTVTHAINNSDDTATIETSFKQSKLAEDSTELSIWPQFDALDSRITKIALPCIANFAINPLIGAVDLFWVNRMGNALAVAGQAAANQVFNTAFWMVSVLPGGEFHAQHEYLMCTALNTSDLLICNKLYQPFFSYRNACIQGKCQGQQRRIARCSQSGIGGWILCCPSWFNINVEIPREGPCLCIGRGSTSTPICQTISLHKIICIHSIIDYIDWLFGI